MNTACRGQGTSWRQHCELQWQCDVTVVDIPQTLRDNAEDTSCGETGAGAYSEYPDCPAPNTAAVRIITLQIFRILAKILALHNTYVDKYINTFTFIHEHGFYVSLDISRCSHQMTTELLQDQDQDPPDGGC